MHYFAYGSNMDQAQMNERCPDSNLIGKGVLKNYRLDFLIFSPRWGGGCADIVEDTEAEVWGLIYEVSNDDIKALDGFEGHPKFYQRITVKIVTENSIIKAEAYEVVNKSVFIPPTKKYLDIIIKAANDFDFPAEYQERLKQTKTADLQ